MIWGGSTKGDAEGPAPIVQYPTYANALAVLRTDPLLSPLFFITFLQILSVQFVEILLLYIIHWG